MPAIDVTRASDASVPGRAEGAGRTAVVTGATGTLGRRLVAVLAARGLAVLAVSRSGAALGEGEAGGLAADLADPGAAAAIAEALPPGELAIAVHAVGLPGSPGVLDVDPAMLAAAVDLKAGGFRRLVDAVRPRLAVGRPASDGAPALAGSRLVAVGGHLGSEPREHAPLASVANAALAALVRAMAAPIGRTGATVHLVAPGPFASPRVDRLIAARAADAGIDVEAARAELLAEQPTGAMPTADDVAWAIATLLDPAATALHGSTLSLDGGARHGLF